MNDLRWLGAYRLSCAMIFAILCACPPGLAQESAASMTSGTYRKLERARGMMEKQQEREAAQLLMAYVPKIQSRPEDYAMVVQYMVSIYAQLGEIPNALQVVEHAYAAKSEMRERLGDLYGNLLVMSERYSDALPVFNAWIPTQPEPPADIFYTRGYAHFNVKDYDAAEVDLLEAIERKSQTEIAVPKSWYELLLANYFYQEKLTEAEALVKTMLAWKLSNAENWRRLARIYLERSDYHQALATLMVAYQQDLLEDEDQRRIISLHAYLGMPENAARLLSEWIAAGQQPRDFENLKQLADYWLLARERQQAKRAYVDAAALDKSGKTHNALANLFFEDLQWQEATTHYALALEKGDLLEPNTTRLMRGIAFFRLEDFQRAQAIFKEIEADDKIASQLKYWRGQTRQVLQEGDESSVVVPRHSL